MTADPERRESERRDLQQARDQYSAGEAATDDTVNLPSWLADELFEIVRRAAETDEDRERWTELERRYHR